MKTKTLINMLGSGLLLLGLTTATTPSSQAQGKVAQRDLQEWLDAQGTRTAPHPLLPQTPRLYSWTNNPDINGDGVPDGPAYRLWYDYAGVLGRDTSYGSKFGPDAIVGTLTERAIGEGMAEVTVRVRITGALIWVTSQPGAGFRTAPTYFGHRETELLANPNLEPARADLHFTATFLNEVGAPMPDLISSASDFGPFPGRWLSFQVVLNATGPLTEAFGVPEGTPGALHWGKPGPLTVPANDNADNGAASGFPNDEFHLFPIGRR